MRHPRNCPCEKCVEDYLLATKGEYNAQGVLQQEGSGATAPAQHEAGAKLDSGKPDASLLQLFPRALLDVARVGTYGQQKYTRGGWQSVDDGRNRYTAAMLRHFFAEEIDGPFDMDPMLEEYGYKGKIRHAAQVAWNALARLELQLREEDDDGE